MKNLAAQRQALGVGVGVGGNEEDCMFAGVDPTYVQSYLFALNMSSKPRDYVSKAHLEFGRLVRRLSGPVV